MTAHPVPAPVAILTKQAVNMGDHAQDVVTAVEILPGETVEDFALRVLTRPGWSAVGPRYVEAEWYVTIHIPAPAESRTA